MDTDLFQILALILLLGLLLTLFGVLQSLGAIRKALDQRGPGEAAAAPVAQATAAPAREADDEPETWARPAETSTSTAAATDDSGWGGASRTGWPAPQEASPTPVVEDEPVAAEPAAATTPSTGTGARVLYGDSGLTTATPNETALRPAETETVESAPDTTAAASAGAAGSEVAGTMDTGTGGTTGVGAATTDTTAGTAGAGAVTETGRSTADDPQEQPFERDGRWWFRRGDELLVYEEQSGQWVPAEEPSSAGSVAATANAPAETAGAPAEGQVTTQQEAAAGSFWKCPSCGAVNGSTATSCRMCFTARP